MEFEFFAVLLAFSLILLAFAFLADNRALGLFSGISLTLAGLALLLDRVRVARVASNNTSYVTWSDSISSIFGLLIVLVGFMLAFLSVIALGSGEE